MTDTAIKVYEEVIELIYSLKEHSTVKMKSRSQDKNKKKKWDSTVQDIII